MLPNIKLTVPIILTSPFLEFCVLFCVVPIQTKAIKTKQFSGRSGALCDRHGGPMTVYMIICLSVLSSLKPFSDMNVEPYVAMSYHSAALFNTKYCFLLSSTSVKHLSVNNAISLFHL